MDSSERELPSLADWRKIAVALIDFGLAEILN